MANITTNTTMDNAAEDFVDQAITQVATWLKRAEELETRTDRNTMAQLRDLVLDDDGVNFVMQFVDRIARPENNAVAADQLRLLVESAPLPSFLSTIDRTLLSIGARLALKLPAIVMPLARLRMRSIVGHLVAPADQQALGKHLSSQRSDGYEVNVNLLGEAVLGEQEAESRLERLVELLHQPEIDYVSVKISAVASQLNHWDYDTSLERVIERASLLFDAARAVQPPTFINLDMEEYHDLHLTVEAFKAALGTPERLNHDAGIVLQAYLPDVFPILQNLVEWANQRHARGGGTIKIRLVKGANLAMERVDAALHGWVQAPYQTKVESDANFRRCLDWILYPDHLRGVRIGIASHNLFDVAWTKLLSEHRGVTDRVQFEMLQGMAPAHAKAVNEADAGAASPPMLLYTPSVADDDFDVAIGYLFRRLEENASEENFMRSLFDLTADSEEFAIQTALFRQGVTMRNSVHEGPRREQDRSSPKAVSLPHHTFTNEPDTDPTLKANRDWIARVRTTKATPCRTQLSTSIAEVTTCVTTARNASQRWATTPLVERRRILHRVADGLNVRRGELIATMMAEASKTISEADIEISEAVDFARWYGNHGLELGSVEGASFKPFGVVAVIPPWNFPVAIPAGGVLAALAAGNSVIFKPAPQTPRCAEIVAEVCWASGVPADVLQFLRVPDDDAGQHLVQSVDAVILTGSTETAQLFRTWKPDMRLLAETSGKNALIITPSADLDLAANDLVRSAFGHAGQKCSAASLAILVGDVYSSERFRRQLIDAAQSLTIGPAKDLSTDIAPLVDGGNNRLQHAASSLEGDQQWLLKPVVDGDTMSPGILDGVAVGSWFHRTECFGPVLGLMHAKNLGDAVRIANSSDFGLTGGIHTLDPSEMHHWMEHIEVGNGYVNRPITGAIVQRQPFGGWKRSSVGLGAKAGGINYLTQLGTWAPTPNENDYQAQWDNHFSKEHDDTGLECEANIFRYCPLAAIGIRIANTANQTDIDLVEHAANVCGVPTHVSRATDETPGDFIQRMVALKVERVRLIGPIDDQDLYIEAIRAGIHLVETPVTPAGRIELQHYLREQAISITLHRFGNLINSLVRP